MEKVGEEGESLKIKCFKNEERFLSEIKSSFHFFLDFSSF